MLFVSSPLSAAPSPAEKEAAHKFMDDGVAKMRANDPVHALENFLKAHELMHVPTTGVAVAKAHLAAGHLVEAHSAASDVVKMAKEPGEPKVFEKARKEARDIEASVKGKIPTVRIHVRGPAPTLVAIDGAEIPVASLAEPVPVNPGKRLITAKAADGSEGRTEIEMKEGDKSDADVSLLPKSASSADVSKPADKPADKKPADPNPKPGEKPKVLGFGNDEGSTRSHRSGLAEGLIFGGFGVGAIGIGVGAVTGLMTLGKASDVKDNCANNVCGPEAKDDLDGANTLGLISTVGFVVGIAGLGAGILGLVMPEAMTTKGMGEGPRFGLRLHPTANGIGGTF